MKFRIQEALETSTPYMLTRNGNLIKCGLLHPYIKYHPQNDNKSEIEYLLTNRLSSIKWFLDYTEIASAKSDLLLFLQLVFNNESYNIQRRKITNILGIVQTDQTAAEYDIEQLFLLLNEEFNQEFCRVRTSNLRFAGDSHDIYFRISSVGFNWFDIIWQCVYENKEWISSITITSDSQAFNSPTRIYRHSNVEFDHVDIDTFITLDGNPVIEKWSSWQYQQSLNEYFYNVHPGHINHQMNIMRKEFLNEQFGKLLTEASI